MEEEKGQQNGEQAQEREEGGGGVRARLIIELTDRGEVQIGGGAEKAPLLAYGMLSAARLVLDRKAREPQGGKILRPEFGGIPGGGGSGGLGRA